MVRGTDKERKHEKLKAKNLSDLHADYIGRFSPMSTRLSVETLTYVVVQGARLPWLWEYKRKERKIPKKEREKKKRRDFMTY